MTVCHQESADNKLQSCVSPKIRILWIKSDYVDPPDTGGKIRTYNLIRQLTRRCPLTYISLQSNSQSFHEGTSVDWASQVQTYPHSEEKKSGLRFALRVLTAMFSAKPYIVQKYDSPEIRNCQHQVFTADSESPDSESTVLVCDFLEMTENVAWQLPCPKVLFEHNVESIIWHRYFQNERNPIKKAYFWFEYRRMQRYEIRACNRFDLVLAVSSHDKETLKQMGVTTPIEIIETGVDTEFFAPKPSSPPIPGRLLFLGSLDWMPNIDGIEWFVREVYPQIKKSCPHVSLDIVGRRPVAEIESMPQSDASINVYGSVPDVRPYLSNADIFVVPLRIGSGTRLKIFEAMAMHRPVVSTTVGAEGLPIQGGRDILLGDSSTEFADAVISFLKAPGRKQEVANMGFELVTQNYAWSTVSARFHEVCSRLCQEYEKADPQ